MTRHRITTAVAFLTLLVAAVLSGCGSGADSSAKTLKVAWVIDPCWSQVPVADKLGYFKEAGVDVEIVPFPTGAAALEALAGGAVDIANGGDVPTASAAVKNPKLRVVADGARWAEGRFVARRSAGINAITDLSGRKIAVPLGSSAQYFATKFLAEAGVTAQLVQTGPAEILTAITNRDVDAIAVFQPMQAMVIAALGGDGVQLQGREKYNQHSLYLANADTVSERAEDVSKFLGAIEKADAPLTAKDPAARDAVAQATNLDGSLIETVLAEFQFTTQLGPELASDLADRARWAQAQGRLAKDATVPDYSTLITPAPLDSASR